jgi:hypothetical protein
MLFSRFQQTYSIDIKFGLLCGAPQSTGHRKVIKREKPRSKTGRENGLGHKHSTETQKKEDPSEHEWFLKCISKLYFRGIQCSTAVCGGERTCTRSSKACFSSGIDVAGNQQVCPNSAQAQLSEIFTHVRCTECSIFTFELRGFGV